MLNTQVALSNSQLVDLWLHGKSPNTADGYRRYAERFFRHIGDKPLEECTLMDLQLWSVSLASSENSRRVAVGAIKSLFSFAKELGAISSNLGILVKTPNAKNRLAERILTEDQVHALIENASNQRDRVLLRLLYFAGLRVSEVCALKWRDLSGRGDGGQITVFGKGGKTRVVLVGSSIWQEILELKDNARRDEPVFLSGKGGHLCRSMVFHIVKKAGALAGIEGNVSPHWLRHSHASHSLDRGAPIHLLQRTLGHSSVAITEKYLHARPTDSSGLYLPDF
ncbi:MAG: tyrosine-type recombinase/integrase [Nostocaceae cyanobacterium]|nr:tyrosine-type recombinase/integrase [Nostocaceae cyanobacterium]